MAAISSAVRLLGSVLIHKVNFVRGVEGQVQLLKDELIRMQCFLRSAAKKQADDENWISEIREVALDAEDVIQMFSLKVESRALLQRYAFFPNHLYHLDRFGKEIEGWTPLIKAAIGAGLRIHVTRPEQEWRTSNSGDSWFLGRRREFAAGEDEGRALHRRHRGIVKSTMARMVYNAAAGFECLAWVVVSSELRAEETMKQLMVIAEAFVEEINFFFTDNNKLLFQE